MTSLRLIDAARFTDRDNPELHQIAAWNDFQKGVPPEQVEAFFKAFRAAPVEPVAVPASQNPAVKALLQFIYSGEGGYTSVNRGRAGDTPGGVPDLTSMTIGEIKKLQAAEQLFAVGAAQFIPSTLPIAQAAAKLPDNAPFNAENQDRLATALLLGGKRPKLAAYLLGRSDDLDAAQIDMAKEWASVPLPNGKGFYDGDSAGNQATKKAAAVSAALVAARTGITGSQPEPPKLAVSLQQPAKARPKSILLKVAPEYQNDNASGTGYRECFSSTCAMLARFHGKIGSDDAYNKVRARFGDTTDANAQIKALASLGLTAVLTKDNGFEQLEDELISGNPVGLGWLHKGPISKPSGGGHWSAGVGFTASTIIQNDPNGEADMLNGDYVSRGRAGASVAYSRKNWERRWCCNDAGVFTPGRNGWMLTCVPTGVARKP
jgi:hypothetical protein